MVNVLCDVQRLAYQRADDRQRADVLRFHLNAFQFANRYQEIFGHLQDKHRKLFGVPFHSIVAHMAELYRCISLRSIVAEASERSFHDHK